MGHSVEWFSASFPGADAVETLDGIRIVRAGRQWSVHWHAFQRYRKRMQRSFDVVIDEVNTLPFFTPFWAGIPSFMLIFQLAREVWWYESPFPINAVGFVTEPLYLLGYRHTPVFTISKSTEQDLRKLGLQGAISIIPIGVEKATPPSRPKAGTATFLYVGRLAPSKRIEHILEAFAEFRRTTGTGALWLVGGGSERYQQSLGKLARRLSIDGSVVFFGRVSLSEKHRLMAEAHILLMTSVREGWGLVVTEANGLGTPAIVYDVPGLRDSVRHNVTGVVVSPRPRDLARAMVKVAADPTMYSRLADRGREWSESFSLDESARLVNERLSELPVA
jgi:glycosyltransferase involved in cell wall biosynthesis